MRIKYIDVLKAFAIIAVVCYHTGLMTYGYLGVDLFLVIAGYLTTKSLFSKTMISENQGGGGKFYIEFEISRIIRLLPPLLFAGAFCMLLAFFTMLPDDYENLSQSVIASNLFGNNILSAITTKNYWDVVNEYKPLMHTWYVGVVMQFYLVYPVLFLLAKFDKRNPKGTLLTMISILAFISLPIYFATTETAHRFYYLPSRFFEFAVGGIAALIYNPKENKLFRKEFVYVCYTLLLVLMFVNAELIPPLERLVAVVGLSCVIICSQNVLENKMTGNVVLAKLGAACYSIFIWHQIVLAFYRYTISSKFTMGSYVVLLIVTAMLSWLSYRFIEQKTTNLLRSKKGKIIIYATTGTIFLLLNVSAAFIYINAGVVRDVPELYISKDNIHRGMHAEYCDRGYQYDNPFTTEKKHWYVIGNSFGRDFVNVILESPIAEDVEISYSTDKGFKKEIKRFEAADKVFVSTLGLNEYLVTEIEIMGLAYGLSPEQIIVVGEKNFGESNGQIYAKRHSKNYFDQYIDVENKKRYIDENRRLSQLYGNRFIDMMGIVINDENKVRVFTPDHHFISADCRHLSKGGAEFFAKEIDWSKYIE